MRRRALIVSAPLAGAMAGTLGLAGCGREVDRPSWIISAEIGTPHPHVLWVVVAQASVRQPWLPDLTGFSGGQHTTTDIRLQTWQVDLPEGRLRPLRVLPLDEVDDGAPSVFVGEWSSAGLTMTVGWRDRHNVEQHRWWHYPAGRLAAAGKAGIPVNLLCWGRLGQAAEMARRGMARSSRVPSQVAAAVPRRTATVPIVLGRPIAHVVTVAAIAIASAAHCRTRSVTEPPSLSPSGPPTASTGGANVSPGSTARRSTRRRSPSRTRYCLPPTAITA